MKNKTHQELRGAMLQIIVKSTNHTLLSETSQGLFYMSLDPDVSELYCFSAVEPVLGGVGYALSLARGGAGGGDTAGSCDTVD